MYVLAGLHSFFGFSIISIILCLCFVSFSVGIRLTYDDQTLLDLPASVVNYGERFLCCKLWSRQTNLLSSVFVAAQFY